MSSARLPLRFQCPLCLELLSSPVQLPCCKKHLCLGCFDRSIAITSTSCAFCRNRIIGFARRKTNKVDEAFAAEIQARTQGLDDITFEEETTPPTDQIPAKPGELHAYYEECKLQRAQALQAQETEALEKTLAFLQTDPEFTDVLHVHEAALSTLTPQPSSSLYSIFSSTPQRRPTKNVLSSQKKGRAKPKAAAVLVSLKSWSCDCCTFVNRTNLSTCSMCGSHKAASTH
ncbi:hypothetical protein, variant [Saprolegnia diclina VS20]|uniref:RING-type E3 ubiquitin transferase n=1 Tax=Saprolegnia diclina (strain VS20) TaxID=1156394 RepID=T0R1R2_SAPDV|nr:hypothetical protein, variant [Saprolegnia diclina VS20]EQC40280.1 hypothetical protein, variant [Saprolegnia diclina VS20]|eukprot:XP_008605979.1 hypothetical protein, variant [Saprolegnia diclina VS20]